MCDCVYVGPCLRGTCLRGTVFTCVAFTCDRLRVMHLCVTAFTCDCVYV